MSFHQWLNYLKSAEKESSLNGCFRRVIYKFPDGKQMLEEYHMDTGLVERRAWRRCRQLMQDPVWDIEVGDQVRQIQDQKAEPVVKSLPDDILLIESNQSPLVTKRSTPYNIEWRIRNLPYPIYVYSVRPDADKRKIIISTSNKKYYKLLPVPELERCHMKIDESNISVHHQYNTLIITYRKPQIVLEMEAQVLSMLKNVPTEKGMDDIMKQLMAPK